MKASRVVALRAFPSSHRFLLNAVSMGAWLEPMIARRIPLFLSVARGADWRDVYDILAEFPDLVCVICDHGCWGMDRLFRPCWSAIRTSTSIPPSISWMAGWRRWWRITAPGASSSAAVSRILFRRDDDGAQACRIPAEAKAAIAGGNLERILAEVQ